jgi:hypothetical protein
MEKSAEFQIRVFKQDGKLLMRLPGGKEIPYDNRFGNLQSTITTEGDYRIFPLED